MKIQIRKGLFETNSSSVHSLVMCQESDFDLWKSGDLIYSKEYKRFVPLNDKDYVEWSKKSDKEKEDDWIQYDYLTYDQFFYDYGAMEYETYSDTFVTNTGEKVVAFGYFGHD